MMDKETAGLQGNRLEQCTPLAEDGRLNTCRESGNDSVKLDMARELVQAGLSATAIHRILNLDYEERR